MLLWVAGKQWYLSYSWQITKSHPYWVTSVQDHSIKTDISGKIVLSDTFWCISKCKYIMLCGNNLNNLNTIDLFINIYDSISLSPIILMERNFKSDPDPRYETNKNGKLYWLVIFYIFTETIFFILDFDDIRYKNTYHMDLSVTLMFVYNNMYCGHSKC